MDGISTNKKVDDELVIGHQWWSAHGCKLHVKQMNVMICVNRKCKRSYGSALPLG